MASGNLQMLNWLTAPSCMELNNYILGVAAAAVVGNIFWFFKWCDVQAKLTELVANYGVDNSD